MEKPKILSDEQIEQIYYGKYEEAKAFSEKYATSLSPSNFSPRRPADRQRSFDVTHRKAVYGAIAQAQLDADAAYYEPLIQQARQEGRDSTIEAVNKILSPLKLHLCWITEDGNPEPLSYGLADKYDDEIDVASLQMDRSSQLLKEIEKIGWHGKAEYPCHQYPYFGILEGDWQSLKSKYGGKK